MRRNGEIEVGGKGRFASNELKRCDKGLMEWERAAPSQKIITKAGQLAKQGLGVLMVGLLSHQDVVMNTEKMGLIVGNGRIEMVKLECKGSGNGIKLVQNSVGGSMDLR